MKREFDWTAEVGGDNGDMPDEQAVIQRPNPPGLRRAIAYGSLSEDQGIAYVHTTNLPLQTKPQLKKTTKKVHAGLPLTIYEADLLTESDMDPQASVLHDYGPVVAPVAGYVAGAAAKTAIDHNPHWPELGTLPAFVHDFANLLAAPLPAQFAATEATYMQHIPTTVVGLGVAYGGVQWLSDRYRRHLRDDAKEAQELTRERTANGTQSYVFSKAVDGVEKKPAYVVYSGNGKATATSLVKHMEAEVIQITYKPVKGPHVVSPPSAGAGPNQRAMRNADVINADAVFILPNAADYEIYARRGHTPEAYDIGVSRTSTLIDRIDDACQDPENDVPLKHIFVVGDDYQEVSFIESSRRRKRKPISDVPLSVRVAEKNVRRGLEHDMVHMVPLTTLVTRQLVEYSPGYELRLAGTDESLDQFEVPFYQALDHEAGYSPKRRRLRRVIFNQNDRDTLDTANPKADPPDLPIVHHDSRGPLLADMGFEDYIVVPQLARAAIDDIFSKYPR